MVNTALADTFFDSLTPEAVKDQTDYWEKLAPQSLDDMFRRWLFAFTSIHTSWKGNVYGYEALKDFLPWKWNKPELNKRLRNCGCGLYQNRTEYIWDFSRKFWDKPTDYLAQAGEPWRAYRDRLVEQNRGIGIAKVSYVLELCYPITAKVLCGDIHQCRLYGVNRNLTGNGPDKHAYETMEYHWVKRSREKGVGAPVARQLFWNNLKRKANSRFWSWVFEPEDMKKELDERDAAIAESERREIEEPLFVWAEQNEKPKP